MKLAKKVLTIVSLSSIGLAVSILIAGVFGLNVFSSGIWLYLFLSLGTIALACGFAISSINLMKKQKSVPYISLILISISLILALITYWSGFSVSALFNKFTIAFSATTILFIIIVSTSIKLNNKYKVLQLITFSIIVFVDVVIILSVWNVPVFALPLFTQFFIIMCLVAFALLFTLGIFGKRMLDNDSNEIKAEKSETDFVKIPSSEYEKMKQEIAQLKQQITDLEKD